ncbi:hypothetical protein [Microtetraspora glauca]|uniref:SnoaL-like domain-containing protein n=1 Tax=Microtetraspora glauca TaxID=1996 RepID=A0ABV3GQB6_MICGL
MITDATLTRQAVRGYHDARFRGDVPAATAQLAETFAFQSPMMSSADPPGTCPASPASSRSSPEST